MENQSLLMTLTLGTSLSFILFWLFYRIGKMSGKMAALLAILVVQAVYLPLGIIYWAGLDVFAIHFAFFTMMAYGLGIITSHRDEQRRMDARLGRTVTAGWFHWAPATIIGFFLVLAVVDATIITLASKGANDDFMERFLPEPLSGEKVASVFPGAVSHDFQEKYDQFNNYLKQLKEQGRRGWKITGGWSSKPILQTQPEFRITVVDKEGKAVTGAKADIRFLRPSDKSMDTLLDLPEVAQGEYGAPVALPAAGLWNLVLTIRKGESVHEVQGETWLDDQQ